MPKKSKVYGSLVQRVVLVLVFLVVVPLIIDGLLLLRRDALIKQHAAFNQLTLMERTFGLYFDQWQALSLARLGDASDFTFNSELICTDSKIEQMVGTGEFFVDELKQAYQRGMWIFRGRNPYTGQEELFFIKKQGERLEGLSVAEQKWLQPLARFRPFVFSLADAKRFPSDEETRFFPVSGGSFFLQVSIPLASIAQFEGNGGYHHIILLWGMVLLIGGGGACFLVYKMAGPLNELTNAMEAVAVQDYSSRYQSQALGFEINELGGHFNQMMEALLAHMEEAQTERVAKELLKRELEIGRAVQHQLLPQEIPHIPGYVMGSHFTAAKEVAGDFYDLFAQDEQSLFFVIADASDKGISACLYSFLVRSMLRAYAKTRSDLAEIVKLTNNLFCRDTATSGNFVTAWLGIIDVRTDILTYVSAGHYPAIWISRSGELEELTTSGMALGVQEVAEVELGTKEITAEGQLFLYTDGILDAQNEKGELFGKSRLFNCLQSYCKLEPSRLVDTLMRDIEAFTGGGEPYDDLTVLSLQKS